MLFGAHTRYVASNYTRADYPEDFIDYSLDDGRRAGGGGVGRWATSTEMEELSDAAALKLEGAARRGIGWINSVFADDYPSPPPGNRGQGWRDPRSRRSQQMPRREGWGQRDVAGGRPGDVSWQGGYADEQSSGSEGLRDNRNDWGYYPAEVSCSWRRVCVSMSSLLAAPWCLLIAPCLCPDYSGHPCGRAQHASSRLTYLARIL